MSLTAICFWVAYVGGLCAAVLYPVVGVALYILVYHLNPDYQWWGASIGAIGLRTSMTVAIATLIGIWIRMPRFSGEGRQFTFPLVMLGALVAYALLSLALGVGVSWRGLHHAEKAVKVYIFVLILVRCVQRPGHYLLVIASWLLGVLYIGYQAWGGVGTMLNGRLSDGIGGPDFAESSDLAVHLVATLPLIGAFFFTSRTWRGRIFALATGALACNAIILTRTRNAFVGIGAMIVFAALSLPRGYRLKGWAAIVAGGVLALQLADPGWWQRMATINTYRQDPAVAARFEYWRAAVEMVYDHPLGIGMGNFHQVVTEYVEGLDHERSAHNTFMACLAELGIPGALILLLVIAGVFLQLRGLRTAARGLPETVPVRIGRVRAQFHLKWQITALQIGLIGYLVCGMFTTRLWAEDLWVLLTLPTCLANVVARLQSTPDELPELRPVEDLPAGPLGECDVPAGAALSGGGEPPT